MPIPLTIIEDDNIKTDFYKDMLCETGPLQGTLSCYPYRNYDDWKNSTNYLRKGVYIVDNNLGKGRENEGMRVVKIVLKTYPDARVFVISAYKEIKKEVEKLGARFFHKSIDAARLRATIAEVRSDIQNHISDTDHEPNPQKNYPQVEEISPRVNPSLVYMDFQRTWIDPQTNTLTPGKLNHEQKFIIKKALNASQGHGYQGIGQGWKGILSSWAQTSSLSSIPIELIDSPVDIPQNIDISKDEKGYVSKMSFDEFRLDFSSPNPNDWKKLLPNQKKHGPEFLDLFFEIAQAYNLVKKVEIGELTKEEAIKYASNFSLEGQVEFLKYLFESSVRSILSTDTNIDIEASVVDDLEKLSLEYDFPVILGMELGEVDHIDHENKQVHSVVNDWLTPNPVDEMRTFSLERFSQMGITVPDSYFLLTTIQWTPSNLGAEVELIDRNWAFPE